MTTNMLLFLDAIASPFEFYPITGIAIVLISLICLIGLTMLLLAFFQRKSNENKKEEDE